MSFGYISRLYIILYIYSRERERLRVFFVDGVSIQAMARTNVTKPQNDFCSKTGLIGQLVMPTISSHFSRAFAGATGRLACYCSIPIDL